jgi:antitoxin MazE
MRVTVKKWGNSAAVRIPAAVMAAARVTLDQPVEVREEDGRIVIEPVRPEGHDLATLVAAITDENRHDSVETGAKRGREAW